MNPLRTVLGPRTGEARQTASRLLGSLFMAAFAVIAAWRFSQSGQLYFVFLVFRDLVLAVLFLKRHNSVTQGSARDSALAYASTFLPLMYLAPQGGTPWTNAVAGLLAVAGFLIATLAGIELGTRIGISPAVRGERSRTGVYRYFRHPMYSGYLLAEVGWILLNPWNVLIYALSATGYFLRMRAEDRLWRDTARGLF